MKHDILLGVNIDHVATLRQARGTRYPEPLHAALLVEQAGADSVTLHLREDRRHIQDRDVVMLRACLQTKMNLEMAVTEEMLSIAEQVKPHDCCLVPERRAELTTEGGLDVVAQKSRIHEACQRLSAAGIRVSLFIDADARHIEAASECGAPVVEIHTGRYGNAETADMYHVELNRIRDAVVLADSLGLQVNAGHGIHYHNVNAIAAIQEIRELNIGHAIVAQSLFVGLTSAVAEMKRLMLQARHQ